MKRLPPHGPPEAIPVRQLREMAERQRAELEQSARELVAGMRRAADDDDWGDCPDRPSPEKLRRIADFVEGALPLTDDHDSRRLMHRLRIVGLV